MRIATRGTSSAARGDWISVAWGPGAKRAFRRTYKGVCARLPRLLAERFEKSERPHGRTHRRYDAVLITDARTNRGEFMEGPIVRCGLFGSTLVAVLALLSGSAVGARNASFTVKAPASVVNEAAYTVTVSGFSGPYRNVMVAKEKGLVSCPAVAKNTQPKQTKSVPTEHKFSLTFHELQITGHPPQTFTTCAYLFSGSKYIVKISHYQIVPDASEQAEKASEG